MTSDIFESFGRRLTIRAEHDPLISEADFGALALELFGLQYTHVEAYRRLCDHTGRQPDKVRHWTGMATVPTAAFREFDWTSLPPEQRRTVFHSSATTGHTPSRHHHSTASLELYRRLVVPWFRAHLLPDRDRLSILSLVPSVRDAPHSSLAHMVDSLLSRCGTPDSAILGRVDDSDAWELDLAGVVERLRLQVATDSPCLLVGTAYGFVHLLDHLRATNVRGRLPPGSRVMETGGYKGRSRKLERADLYGRLNASLGVPETHIVSEYGMSELSSQAYDRIVGEHGPRAFRFPPWCRVRVLEPGATQPAADGAPGLLTLLDLANVHSVLAIQTEDLGVADGEGFRYLGRARRAEPRGCSRLHAG